MVNDTDVLCFDGHFMPFQVPIKIGGTAEKMPKILTAMSENSQHQFGPEIPIDVD